MRIRWESLQTLGSGLHGFPEPSFVHRQLRAPDIHPLLLDHITRADSQQSVETTAPLSRVALSNVNQAQFEQRDRIIGINRKFHLQQPQVSPPLPFGQCRVPIAEMVNLNVTESHFVSQSRRPWVKLLMN